MTTVSYKDLLIDVDHILVDGNSFRLYKTKNNDIVNSSDFGLDHFPKESLGNYWKLLAYPFSRQRKP